MEKTNDKNLNITIQNKEKEDNDVVISISSIFKKLKKYFLLWVISAVVIFVLTFGYATLTTQIRKPMLNALISFSYAGIEKGTDPNGRKFDVNTIKNPSIIESALTELNLGLENLELVREGISIKGIVPSDAIDRITTYQSAYEVSGNINAAKEMLDVTYYPTQFKVYFDYNNTEFDSDVATNILNTILTKYQDYFYEEYGYNESLGTAVSAISYESYDYSEAIDVFNNNLTTLRKYVKQLANEDSTRFRSAATGYTFDDLYQAIITIQDIDLDKVSSYITVNNLTKDKEAALAYYDYRMNTLNRQKTALEEQLKSVQDSIGAYEKDQIFIFSGTDEANTNMSSSVASEQYDNMVKEKLNLTEDLADTKQSINYYKERKDALQNNPSGAKEKTENLDQQLKDLDNKINELIDLTSQTSDDYYKNVSLRNAYNVLVPASSTVTDRFGHIVNNAKLPLVALELLAIFAYFVLAVVEAIVTDTRRKAAESAAVAEAAEAEEEPDEDEKKEEKKTDKASEKNPKSSKK